MFLPRTVPTWRSDVLLCVGMSMCRVCWRGTLVEKSAVSIAIGSWKYCIILITTPCFGNCQMPTMRHCLLLRQRQMEAQVGAQVEASVGAQAQWRLCQVGAHAQVQALILALAAALGQGRQVGD